MKLAILVLALSLTGCYNPPRPEIFIFRETMVQTLEGIPAILVDYAINGEVYNAVFSLDEEELYLQFVAHLEETGRVTRQP